MRMAVFLIPRARMRSLSVICFLFLSLPYSSSDPHNNKSVICVYTYIDGPEGFADWGIMPNSDLVFEIEVLKYA
jgi:hypothetical protein